MYSPLSWSETKETWIVIGELNIVLSYPDHKCTTEKEQLQHPSRQRQLRNKMKQ